MEGWEIAEREKHSEPKDRASACREKTQRSNGRRGSWGGGRRPGRERFKGEEFQSSPGAGRSQLRRGARWKPDEGRSGGEGGGGSSCRCSEEGDRASTLSTASCGRKRGLCQVLSMEGEAEGIG